MSHNMCNIDRLSIAYVQVVRAILLRSVHDGTSNDCLGEVLQGALGKRLPTGLSVSKRSLRHLSLKPYGSTTAATAFHIA